MLGGAISLAGWMFDVPRFIDWGLSGISIKANAAVCLLFAGAGLLLFTISEKFKPLTQFAGLLTVAVGSLTLAENIIGLDFGIDTILFAEESGAIATSSPGRMGMPASSSFVLIGLALIFLTVARLRQWSPFLGGTALAISALSLVGYGFGADRLYAVPRFTGIAWQTATMIASLGIGLILTVPEHGIAEIASRSDAGGMIFRRLIVAVVVLSLALGWLEVLGLQGELYDAPFGSAVRTLLEIAVLLALVWWTASGVSRHETRILHDSAVIADRDRQMQSVLHSLSDAFLSFDKDLRFTQVNSAASDLFERFGVSTASLTGRYLFEVFPEAERTDLGNGLLQCLKERVPVEMEARYDPFDRWFHSRFFPTADGGVSIFALDVTERKRAEMLVQRRAHELGVLYSFADRLNRADSLDQVYDAALDTITSALDCQRASVLLFDETGVMRFVASRGLSEKYVEAVTGHSPWKPGETGAKPFGISNIDDSELDEELKATISAEGIASLGFIPLISNDSLSGKFMVYYDDPHEFTEAEFEIALTVAYQIAFNVEKKRTEQDLRENEERLRLATQTGKVGVWDWDIRSSKILWTPTVYTMHGVRPGEFDGHVESFSALIHPEDRGFVEKRIKEALEGASPYEIEFRVPMPDGSTNWLYTNAIVLRDASGPYRMIGATVDITGRKIAELELARAAAIVEYSHDAIIGKDLNSIVTSWNRGAERVFGYTAEEMVGKSITILIPPDRADEEEKILARLRRGEYIDHYETVRQRKDGTLLDISLTVSPVADMNGKIIGASKIARDITDKRHTEAARRDREIMKRLVEAQEAERHRIARDLHDHLGQNLTALRLKLESVRSKCNGNASLASEMDQIQNYASRIDTDINYLAWELRPTELDQLGLENALGSFVREWSNTYGIDAEFHASKSISIGRPDPDLETNLYRIVQEGLNNILKHAKASSVSVLIEYRPREIVLIIEDNGVGFEPDSGPKGSLPGGGLGLVGMRERTALLGGTLEIESRSGEGTTVFVRVPNKLPTGTDQDLIPKLP